MHGVKKMKAGGPTSLDMKKYGRGMAKPNEPTFSRKGSIMAKYSKKVMGKEVGDGALYAPPHTMTGKDIGPKEAMLAVSRPPRSQYVGC
jgi:hypothetical protein